MNYFSEYAWMQTLGWTLLHSFWQIGLIALSWAILRPFLKSSSSEKRYLALMGAILTAFLCAVLTFWQLLPRQAEISIMRVSTVELSELPSSQQTPVILSEVASEKSWTQFFNQIAPYLSVLWIIGAVIMGIRFSGGIFYIQKLRYKGLHMVDESWQIKARNLANKLRIKQNWQLKESERVSQPLTIGHFKPLILVPLGMLSSLSPDQIEAILLHELAHIKRSDFLFNMIQSLIEILFFYHPAIWWLSKEIRQEREMCCDDLAVEAMGDAFTYAETLTLLQSYRHSPQQFLTMKAKGNAQSFSKRVKRLFQENPRPSPWRSISATILLIVILSGSGFYAFTQTQKKNQEGNSDIESQEILAEYIIEPEMPQEEIDEITAEIFTYDPQKMLLANRDSENRIEEIIIFGIYNPNPKRPAQKFYKTGLRNFSKAKISIIKTQKGKPMVSLKDPIGDAIWTDKLDQQTVSLKVGDKARFVIPPYLGYGERGAGGVIPPNATLIFDVELVEVK
ncbi:MAG: M56 family metallopeptidase [Bacteroidota bacterium]